MCYVCVSEERELSTAHSQERDCSRSQMRLSLFPSVCRETGPNKNSVYRWPGESLAVALVLGRDLADGGGASSRWLWFVGAWSLRSTELQKRSHTPTRVANNVPTTRFGITPPS